MEEFSEFQGEQEGDLSLEHVAFEDLVDMFRFQNMPIPSEISEDEGQIKLFRAVLDQALRDLVNDPASEKSWWNGIRTHKEEKASAEAGFYTVCALAYLEPSTVQRVASAILETKTGETL